MAVMRSQLSAAGLAAVLVLMAGGAAVAEKPVVQCDVLTVLELRSDGLQRLDAILYDVRSGSLEQFVLEPPPGLGEEEIMEAQTDEISGMVVAADKSLTVPRKRPLPGAGHLLLVSSPTPLPAGGISLDPVKPEAEVRARYLALSSLLPADVRLLPEASGTRVSASDLPAAFSEALAFIDRMVVWRLPADGEGVRLAVAPLPYVPAGDVVIQRRDTIVLMDSHGTLLFFDRFLFKSSIPSALDVTLPAGGKLLAVRVNEVPVREPQERAGVVSVQLAWATSGVVEVFSVREREGLRSDRTELTLDLPQVTTPVLAHRLRWLVPGDASYRVRRSDLRAVLPSTSVLAKEFDFEISRSNAYFFDPGYIWDGDARLLVKVTDDQGSPLPEVGIILKEGDARRHTRTNALGVAVLKVQGHEYQLEAKREGFARVELPSLQLVDGKSLGLDLTLSAGAAEPITTQAALLRPLQAGEFPKEIDQLLMRLEGWFEKMKPIPVSIPDHGKVLAFFGVLPPPWITVELDVRAEK